MAAVGRDASNVIANVGELVERSVSALGDLGLFGWQALTGLMRRRFRKRTLVPAFYSVGVLSVPVVAVTGMFIGMVMAVQTYTQYKEMGFATRIGGIINVTVVRELGPVLAATMLAGRVGSAMAAELGTMRVSEQIDALSCLGVNPVHYLVIPRLLACVVLIPLLTILAEFMGVMGGALICTQVYRIDTHLYWEHSRDYVGMWDLWTSLVKPMFFGVAIALISCHRGFNSRGGAEGVGQAATRAFVHSFVAILVLDFFLVMFLNSFYSYLWPSAGLRIR